MLLLKKENHILKCVANKKSLWSDMTFVGGRGRETEAAWGLAGDQPQSQQVTDPPKVLG